MKSLIVLYFILYVYTVASNEYLKCLVCRSTIKEIKGELAKVDPSREIEIGSYIVDAQGNSIQKKIPLVQSEVYISDVLDIICEKMSDYVRATNKSNGRLTIINLMGPSGTMNREMAEVDIIQDGDLNRSLKFYCESVVGEHEDAIISLFTRKEDNIEHQMCTNIAKLCNHTDFADEDDEDIEQGTDVEHEEL
ncbi:PREDICTED: protein canopy homolog 2 [Dufourea novaeangliae]|uniref:protein canopy homolog 2 n=1 Tax=Dufourea novaeangliae TaxID=178035 RepID=UPI000767494B|nr:PREDICTED: protein canopy homolog 2 [Dufourea novaeangliae]